MKRDIRVRASRGDNHFVAECRDLPVVTQAVTLDQLISNIKEAVSLQLEDEDPADFGLAPNAQVVLSYKFTPHLFTR